MCHYTSLLGNKLVLKELAKEILRINTSLLASELFNSWTQKLDANMKTSSPFPHNQERSLVLLLYCKVRRLGGRRGHGEVTQCVHVFVCVCVCVSMDACLFLLNKHTLFSGNQRESLTPKYFPQILNMFFISQKITISAKGTEKHFKFTFHPPVYIL